MKTLLKTITTVAIVLTCATIYELVEQNSTLRDEIQTLEATMPRIEELQHRRDAADKDLAVLRAQVSELKRAAAETGR